MRGHVHRFLQVFGLQPHRQDTFKLSTDPFFVEKLKDVIITDDAFGGAGPLLEEISAHVDGFGNIVVASGSAAVREAYEEEVVRA